MWIEDRQCAGCAHGEPVDLGPRTGYCCPVLAAIAGESPCEGILGAGPDVLDHGADGIKCTRETR